jgi:hypothetical protein
MNEQVNVITNISPCTTCRTTQCPRNSDAATTNLENPCSEPDQSRYDFPGDSCAIAEQIAPYLGDLTFLNQDAFVDTVQHWLSAAAGEAVATYKLSSAAAALAAVTTLAEAAVKAATDAAAAVAEHVPRMDYSLAEAGFLLSRGKRVLQYELDEGLVIGTHKGASHRISQAEMERQVLRDDGKPGTKKGKKKLPRTGKPLDRVGSKAA